MQTYGPLKEYTRKLEARLERRLDVIVDQFTEHPECSVPQATENRNDMDGAYNFFANEHVSPEAVVMHGLLETQRALLGCPRVLAVQDTSDFNFSSLEKTTGLGYTAGSKMRGLLLHSVLAVRPDGLPLGLLSQQIWTRDPARKGNAKTRRQRADLDKESYRWLDHARAARAAVSAETIVLHVADREGDIYSWFAAPRPANTHILVRVAQAHRIVVFGPDGQTGKLSEVVRAQVPLGTHILEVPRADGRPSRQAVLTMRVAAVQLQPPRNAKKRSTLRPVAVWVIEALEENPPPGAKALCWRLVTTEAMTTLAEAIRVLQEYALRWRIERFHFVLKQGCKVERLQLETAERLANALAVYSQVAGRLLRLTYLARVEPQLPVAQEFTADEVEVLHQCRQKQEKRKGVQVRTVAETVRVIARLGGHLGRKGDGPPGAMVLWRGLRRLHDLVLGFQMPHPLDALPLPSQQQKANYPSVN